MRVPAQHHQLLGSGGALAVQQHVAFHDVEAHVVVGGQVQVELGAFGQVHIEHGHRREGAGRAVHAFVAARNHADGAFSVGRGQGLDGRGRDVLIVGRGHLVLPGHVHPQLHHFQRAAFAGEFLLVQLFVHEAGAGRHPLHVAGADVALVAGRVAVREHALVHDGHGFEAAVGVGRRAQGLFAGGHRHRADVVNEQEGAELTDARPRHGAGHLEAIAHGLLVAVDDLEDAAKSGGYGGIHGGSEYEQAGKMGRVVAAIA